MLTYSPEFVENSDYAYAVARVRALETGLITEIGYNTLMSAPVERFHSLFSEISGIRWDESSDVHAILRNLEESFTQQFFLVKSLIVEDEIKRLISLKYDYELLKLIIKDETGGHVTAPHAISLRSNFSYPVLKVLLENGSFGETGETMYRVYDSLKGRGDKSGGVIDHACDCAYYAELFALLENTQYPFVTGYFIRRIDARNVLAALRLKVRGEKRSTVRERFVPFGTVGLHHLEESFDLNIDGFAARVPFSPLSTVLRKVDKKKEEEEQLIEIEKLCDEQLLSYLRESIFVTFGVEPVLSYLWMKEGELQNLRTILLAKESGMSQEEIRKYVRGTNV